MEAKKTRNHYRDIHFYSEDLRETVQKAKNLHKHEFFIFYDGRWYYADTTERGHSQAIRHYVNDNPPDYMNHRGTVIKKRKKWVLRSITE